MGTKWRKKKIPGIKSVLLTAICCLLLTTMATAQNPAVIDEAAPVTMTAKVVDINQKTRKVKLKTDDGQWHILTVNEGVKNLSEINKGDTVTVIYTEAVAYRLRIQGSQPGIATSDTSAAAGQAANPAGAVQHQTTVTATITAIDPGVPSVTFRGPYKETQTTRVKDPRHLQGVKVGDVVDITYTDAIAIKLYKTANK